MVFCTSSEKAKVESGTSNGALDALPESTSLSGPPSRGEPGGEPGPLNPLRPRASFVNPSKLLYVLY